MLSDITSNMFLNIYPEILIHVQMKHGIVSNSLLPSYQTHHSWRSHTRSHQCLRAVHQIPKASAHTITTLSPSLNAVFEQMRRSTDKRRTLLSCPNRIQEVKYDGISPASDSILQGTFTFTDSTLHPYTTSHIRLGTSSTTRPTTMTRPFSSHQY